MKLFYCLLFHFVIILPVCYSQNSDNNVIRIDTIPPTGILLDKAWKFQSGDNPEYANPDYDDSKWQSINPTLDIHELSQIQQGMVWFRLHLYLDSNLLKKQLSLSIEQSGASEIYLNGKLIYVLGILDTAMSKVKAYDPIGSPVIFPVEKQSHQTLAIRYAVQRGIRYKNIFGSHNFGENITINYTEQANRHHQLLLLRVHGNALFLGGVFFILAVLHLSSFLFYRPQKANLYFGLFAMLTLAGFILNVVSYNINWVEDKFNVFYSGGCLFVIAQLFMLTSLYQQLEQKKGIWFSILVALDIIMIGALALPGYLGWNLAVGYSIYVVNLEIARISFIAVKSRYKGAGIMAIGSVCFVVSWIVFVKAGIPGSLDPLTSILFDAAFLSIPIATSVYLGVDFALTNRLLKKKLDEVEELSQKTIAQEKEKQQILAGQKETLEAEVQHRTAELNNSLKELKSTQAQLIQSEKMASLGELTAGIAHEIQNPLNFVNNFSEVNNELADELMQEAATGNLEVVKAIAKDIKDNQQKINHHGKRADAIVKGMLQHSRTGTATKEPTDINRLADEYLRLAYQGFRARDKSFNATFSTEFDNDIDTADVVPQEIGRVILNLINNAFYAVNEKSKQGVPDYQPSVIVGTRRLQDSIEVSVKDNGNGIPDPIKQKIFQPFFTTKPTGQGTGLGLSLTYDIVKAHGGEIKVQSKEGEGSTFIIYLLFKHNI